MTARLFQTLGLQLLAGTTSDSDPQPAHRLSRLSTKAYCRRAWPGESAFAAILVGGGTVSVEVVGSCECERQGSGESSTPFFYVPAMQRYMPVMWNL